MSALEHDAVMKYYIAYFLSGAPQVTNSKGTESYMKDIK